MFHELTQRLNPKKFKKEIRKWVLFEPPVNKQIPSRKAELKTNL